MVLGFGRHASAELLELAAQLERVPVKTLSMALTCTSGRGCFHRSPASALCIHGLLSIRPPSSE